MSKVIFKALLPAVVVALLALIVDARPVSAQSPQVEPPFGVAPEPMTEPPPEVSTRMTRPRTARARTTRARRDGAKTSRSRPVRTANRQRNPEHRQRHIAHSPPNELTIAESNGYKRLSDLVNFPKFFPGLGVVFVKPDTIPLGPFLCFDRNDRLIATVYMVSTKDIDDHKSFEAPAFTGSVDHVSYYFNSGHPGFEMPHYHIVIWHVSKEEEAHAAH
jgi:hypothetical protein